MYAEISKNSKFQSIFRTKLEKNFHCEFFFKIGIEMSENQIAFRKEKKRAETIIIKVAINYTEV